MLDRASGDHSAVHDALTGNNMEVTCDNGGHYNAQDHVGDLLNHNWQGHEQGIKHVLDGIGENSKSTDQFLNVQAGESAHVLAEYAGKHKDDLLDLKGWNQSIGEANPEMTKALGWTLSPYIPNMVGVEDSYLGSHGFEAMNSADAKGLFAVVDSNQDAAVDFNKNAYASISLLDQHYGFSYATDGRSALGEMAGRIDWAAQSGMNDELAHRIGDAAEEQKQKELLFDTLKETASFSVDKLPVIGPGAELGVNMAAPATKEWLLGSVPDLHAQADISTAGSTPRQYYDILRGAALADPSIAQNPYVAKHFDSDGQLKSFEDIAGPGHRAATSLPNFNEDMMDFMPNIVKYETAFDNGKDPRTSPW